MKNNSVFLLLFILFSFTQPKKYIFICGKKYYLTNTTVYLNDDNLDLKMFKVSDLKKRYLFGYYDEAIRNDSLFIKGWIKYKNDSIITGTKFHFGIRADFDSITNIHLCIKGKIVFFKHYRFKNGAIVDSSTINKELPLK